MGYYIDKENNIKLKREGEKAWVKEENKEREVSPMSNTVVDIMLKRTAISYPHFTCKENLTQNKERYILNMWLASPLHQLQVYKT